MTAAHFVHSEVYDSTEGLDVWRDLSTPKRLFYARALAEFNLNFMRGFF